MERLTTEKPTKEMGMYELAMNCCYVKDNLARYRDFETDADARDLARQLLKKYADGDDAFVDDDDFDEEMLELLIYGTDTIEGLIAVFYRNLWAMAELREQLKEYEQAEEDGLLIRLPVAEGTHVYCIGSCGEICDDYETDCEVCGEHKVVFCTNFDRNLVEHFGETVFLTEAEAEQALAKMKGV